MILYLADLHINDSNPINRQDSVKTASLLKLEYVLKTAKELNATLVLGGDIFETPKPSYSLLNSVMGLLCKYNVPTYSIIGNHDIIGSNTEDETSAIFTLFKSGLIKELDALELDNVIIKGIHYTKEIPEQYYFDSKYDNYKKLLVVHTSLVPNKAIFSHILLEDFKTNANAVLCSHIHQFWCKKVNNIVFLSSGCMTRLKINEQYNEPLFFIIDTKSKPMIKVHKIPLTQKAEFVDKKIEKVASLFGDTLLTKKIESPNIEEAILKSTYTEDVKNHCIERIKGIRDSL